MTPIILSHVKRCVSSLRRCALLLAVILTGCGESQPFPMVRVSGTVRYDDGSLIPANRLMVTFIPKTSPLDPKTHPRPGRAEVDVAEGKFDVVTSLRYGDGLVTGKHRVCVSALDANQMPLPVIPAQYSSPSLTPLIISTDDSPLEIRIPRPR